MGGALLGKFKDFNESRAWQIQSWKKNNYFFKKFLRKNNLSILYSIGSYYYLLFKNFEHTRIDIPRPYIQIGNFLKLLTCLANFYFRSLQKKTI